MAELPGLQLSRVHDYLRRELASRTSEEIRLATGVDVDDSPELLQSLRGDKSKVLREPDGRWRWKSKHYLTGFNELLQFFALAAEGVPEPDLHDCYRGVREDIARLKDSARVYALKSGSRTVLYARDPRLELAVPKSVTEEYAAVSVPDAVEVHRYLVRRGLKDGGAGGGVGGSAEAALAGGGAGKRKRPGGGKKPRGGNKRVKLTNTHMSGIDGVDLSKDFKHDKGGAFG